MSETNYYLMNTTALAFLGDAVYETYIRTRVLSSGEIHSDALHQKAVRYVRAQAQAAIIRQLLPFLTEEEEALVKRARNRKSSSRPRHADPVEYKWATAFEALIGYLSLSEQKERLEEIIGKSIEIVEAQAENGEKAQDAE